MASFLARTLLTRAPVVARSSFPGSVAYSSAPPPLNKPAEDDGDVFVNKAAQRLLWSTYLFLQPHPDSLTPAQLKEPLFSTKWVLPTAKTFFPRKGLRDFLATKATDPVVEARRQEILAGGKLGAKYGKSKAFQEVLRLQQKGFTLYQAIVIKYLTKYPLPEAAAERTITLPELYTNIQNDQMVYDPVIGELQDIFSAPTADELAAIEKKSPIVAEIARSTRIQDAEDFNKEAYTILLANDIESFDFSQAIPTPDQVKAMPDGPERAAHIAARDQYVRTAHKPAEEAVAQFEAQLKGLAAYELKAINTYVSKSVAEWRKNHDALEATAEYKATSSVKPDAELASKLTALFTRFQNAASSN